MNQPAVGADTDILDLAIPVKTEMLEEAQRDSVVAELLVVDLRHLAAEAAEQALRARLHA